MYDNRTPNYDSIGEKKILLTLEVYRDVATEMSEGSDQNPP